MFVACKCTAEAFFEFRYILVLLTDSTDTYGCASLLSLNGHATTSISLNKRTEDGSRRINCKRVVETITNGSAII